jgi:uncharacterized protein
MNERPVLRTVLLATAILLAGGLVGRGLVNFRMAERYVSVKGVAERTVKADVGLWPLRFVSAADALDAAQRKIEADRRVVLGFLDRHGLDSTRTELQGLEVVDTRTNAYQEVRTASRFIINMTLMVRTSEPEKIQAASQDVGELVAAGVVLSSGGGYGSGPTYLFTRLNDLKPAMLAEANTNARKAAEQFAKESRSRVGGIRRASQGVFEILPRDQAPGIMEGSQLQKTLRVVSTVDYFLKD